MLAPGKGSGPLLHGCDRTEAAGRISFDVPGVPETQGSKTGHIRHGRVVLVELADMRTRAMRDKGQRGGRLKRWRATVAGAARIAMTGAAPMAGPVVLGCSFRFERPKSHYTAKGNLTKKARDAIPRKDLSKLTRAIEDAMTGIVYLDDVQIVDYQPIGAARWKQWADGDPGVSVAVWRA